MGNKLGESLKEMLEEYKLAPAEGTQEELQDTYPNITIEDAQRVKDGLTALLESHTAEEQRKLQREYRALHSELRKKYKRKSGKP